MKRFLHILKRVLQILFVGAVVVAFVVTVVSAVNKDKSNVCSSVQIDIDYPEGLQLIEKQEVMAELLHLSRGKIVGKPLQLIDFRTLELVLERNPYIANAELFYDQRKVLHVSVRQRIPFLRVINTNDVSYYLSKDSYKMPLHHKFTTDVFLAFGHIDDGRGMADDSIFKMQLLDLVLCLQQDTLLNSMMDHVYVHESGDFELMPRVAGHTVWFGKTDSDTKVRLRNLKEFYKKVLVKRGWNLYGQLNIESPLQVVAVKKQIIQ